jgi:hypothetical protein
MTGDAQGIDGGRVVGWVRVDAERWRDGAALWDRRGRHELAVPTATSARADGIADRYVAGSASFTSPDGVEQGRAVVWRDGAATILDGLTATGGGAAFDVNRHGWAVGIADPAGGGQSHAVLWRPQRR